MQKLSIVIPVYNTAIYLKECLESIINQTYSEIEIICVDDCSPDNSAEIIKEYAAKDSRIKYIKHTENKFQGGARNTGINAAEGSYITFVDSDDYMADKSCYENIIKKIEQYKTDIGIFSFFEIKEEKLCLLLVRPLPHSHAGGGAQDEQKILLYNSALNTGGGRAAVYSV